MKNVNTIAAAVAARSCSTIRIWRGVSLCNGNLSLMAGNYTGNLPFTVFSSGAEAANLIGFRGG
jgi:hypothetical protein